MKDIKEIRAEIDKLNTSFSQITDKYKKIKADMPTDNKDMEDLLYQCMDNIGQRLNYVWDAIYSVGDNLYSHSSVGHLPRLSGGQMKKVLDKCGLGEDFNVNVPTVYAKIDHKGTVFQVNLPIKK